MEVALQNRRQRFYFGLFAQPGLIIWLGIAEAAMIAGLWRRVTYLAVGSITGVTLIGVWRSVLDPWGWYPSGADALFYPSLIIFAAVLFLLADEAERRSSKPGAADVLPVHRR